MFRLDVLNVFSDKGNGVEIKGKCAKCWQGTKEECMSACEPNLKACREVCPGCKEQNKLGLPSLITTLKPKPSKESKPNSN